MNSNRDECYVLCTFEFKKKNKFSFSKPHVVLYMFFKDFEAPLQTLMDWSNDNDNSSVFFSASKVFEMQKNQLATTTNQIISFLN